MSHIGYILSLFVISSMTDASNFFYTNNNQDDITQIDIPTNSKYVAIYNTKITFIPAFSFQTLSNCTRIQISNNRFLDNIEKQAFAGLESVEILDLSCNGIKELRFGMFLHLDGCLELDLHADNCVPQILDIIQEGMFQFS